MSCRCYRGIDQLRELFGERGNPLLANSTHVYMGVQDTDAAERVSRAIGKTTVSVARPNTSRGYSTSYNLDGSSSGQHQESTS